MEYEFTKHALEQLEARNISVQQVDEVLQNPRQTIHETDYTVFQSVIKFEEKAYLLRVFLNTSVAPNKIITVYKTSKIGKYHEGEI